MNDGTGPLEVLNALRSCAVDISFDRIADLGIFEDIIDGACSKKSSLLSILEDIIVQFESEASDGKWLVIQH